MIYYFSLVQLDQSQEKPNLIMVNYYVDIMFLHCYRLSMTRQNQPKSEQTPSDRKRKKSHAALRKFFLLDNPLKTLSNVVIDSTARLFNTVMIVGLAAMYFDQFGENPVDGLNNVYTEKRVQAIQGQENWDADQFYLDFLAQKQITFYADTNHLESSIREYFVSDTHIERMSRAGVKHVCIEYPAQFQHFVDDLVRGEITRDEFITGFGHDMKYLLWNEDQVRAYHETLADFILRLHERDIQFHMVDSYEATRTMSRETYDYVVGSSQSLARNLKRMIGDPITTVRPYDVVIASQYYTIERFLEDGIGFLPVMLNAGREIMQKRGDGDNAQIAENIMDAVGDERAVVLYGGMHMYKDHDLDELVGEDRSQLIGLHRNEIHYADAIYAFLARRMLPDQPDYVHFLLSDRVYREVEEEQHPSKQRNAARAPAIS